MMWPVVGILYLLVEIAFWFQQKWALHAINSIDAKAITMNMKYRRREDVVLRVARLIKGTVGYKTGTFPQARVFEDWIKGWVQADSFHDICRGNVREFISSFFFDAHSSRLDKEELEVRVALASTPCISTLPPLSGA